MSVFIAKRLKEARTSAGMTQEEVARGVNLSKSGISDYEADRRTVTAEDIVRFAKLYNVDVRELLLEEYVSQGKEQILFKRYASVFKVYEQLSDRSKEDVYRLLKQYVN